MQRSRQRDETPGAPSGVPLPGMASLASAVLGRFAVFAVLWWLLTDGRADGLVFGLCCAALAALLPLVIDDPRTSTRQPGLLPTVLRLPLLVPFFLWQSLSGGVDVALRAFKPRLPLAPAMIVYPLRLPPGPAPVLMASLVSLMPGTLAMISGTRLRVHVLDETRAYRDDLERLERRVARVFGIDLADPKAESRDPS
jgi:multicomponent Na+:H+ antiporter subunit E